MHASSPRAAASAATSAAPTNQRTRAPAAASRRSFARAGSVAPTRTTTPDDRSRKRGKNRIRRPLGDTRYNLYNADNFSIQEFQSSEKENDFLLKAPKTRRALRQAP